MPSTEEILTKLNSLGNKPKKIAKSLEHLGINGIPNNAQYCPLARYLKTQFPDRHIRVGSSCLWVDDINIFMESHFREFIYQVDRHKYPSLIATTGFFY